MSWVPYLFLAIAFIIFPLILPVYQVGLLVQFFILAIFVMSYNFILGYGGLLSFAHAGFFGVGAYSVGLLGVNMGIDSLWLGVGTGLATSLLLAVVFGFFALRAQGIYFLMLTLAFGQILWALATKWRDLTGGSDGLPGIPTPDLGIISINWNDTAFYYFVFIIFAISFILLMLIIKSQFGRTIIGIRENEPRVISLGYNTWLYKYVTFIIAALFASMAGSLNSYYLSLASPDDTHWRLTAIAITAVIIGGRGTLIGPLVGTAIYMFLSYFISGLTLRWPLFLGGAFILIVMYAPDGIVGLLKNIFRKKSEMDGRDT